MHHTPASSRVHNTLAALDPTSASFATEIVETLLTAAEEHLASDVHIQPTPEGYSIRWRIDGVLQPVGVYPRGASTDPINRLKVLARLLTYRTDIPQEGRIDSADENGLQRRVSTFPTLHGERVVIRLLGATGGVRELGALGLPDAVRGKWQSLLSERAGALLVTGPAGSGKTTTAYASLRGIAESDHDGRSIVSLEDPIEMAVERIAQAQVNETTGLTLLSGLKSLLRQDPEVIFVGEIRDAETAAVAFQAALTGQLMLTTFHAASAAGAISRLADMGIEPFVLRSGVLGILNQRLVRRLCDCANRGSDENRLGLAVEKCLVPNGCDACLQTGYRGRTILVELLDPRETRFSRELRQTLLSASDAATIESVAVRGGMKTIWDAAIVAVENGVTSPSEIRRVMGFRRESDAGSATHGVWP